MQLSLTQRAPLDKSTLSSGSHPPRPGTKQPNNQEVESSGVPEQRRREESRRKRRKEESDSEEFGNDQQCDFDEVDELISQELLPWMQPGFERNYNGED